MLLAAGFQLPLRVWSFSADMGAITPYVEVFEILRSLQGYLFNETVVEFRNQLVKGRNRSTIPPLVENNSVHGREGLKH